MFQLAEHSCGDCKLKCIDCNAQICPKCMVQCPVGNRCKACTQRFTSHVLQIAPNTIVRAFCSSIAVGLLFAIAQPVFNSMGFYMLILVYFIGTFTGNLIFKICGRKLGSKVAIAVAAGIVLGSICTTFVMQNIYQSNLKQMISESMTVNPNPTIPMNDQSNSNTKNTPSDAVDDASNPNNIQVNRAYAAIAMAQAHQNSAPISLSLIIFVIGAISPFLGWGNPLSALFRR